jgi:hypothetical protein
MRRWPCFAMLIGLAALLSVIVLIRPVLTNDGPVHIAIGHLLGALLEESQSLKNDVYELNLKLNPNLTIYLLISLLLRAFSPAVTESIIQMLSLLGPLGAGFFALGSINRESRCLAVLMLPLSMSVLFYLGLYNHCLSIAAFLLVLGCYFRLQAVPSRSRAAWLAAALIVAFLCHASGYAMSVISVASMITAKVVLAALRQPDGAASRFDNSTLSHAGRLSALKPQFYSLAALFLSLPLALLFLTNSGGPIFFGTAVPGRIFEFATLSVLYSNAPFERVLSTAYALVIWFMLVFALWQLYRTRHTLPVGRRDDIVAALCAMGAATVVALAIPDGLGGGWTHFHRFLLFPYFWAVIIIGFARLPLALAVSATSIGTVMALALTLSLVSVQSAVRQQTGPLASIDRLIGAHCTVLPLILNTVPLDRNGRPLAMRYHPFYQVASLLELRDDRVVLFNYLLRLEVYPVRFRSAADPQRHIFHWRDYQVESDISTIDIAGFEKSAKVAVDYILVRGRDDDRPAARAAMQKAIAGTRVVHVSPDGHYRLYRRPSTILSRCQERDLTQVRHHGNKVPNRGSR